MIDKEILANAIDKAITNGYKFIGSNLIPIDERPAIIFSHLFAKAFWGEYPRYYYRWDEVNNEDQVTFDDGATGYNKYWQHHLQQMVLEEEPFKYLEKFL